MGNETGLVIKVIIRLNVFSTGYQWDNLSTEVIGWRTLTQKHCIELMGVGRDDSSSYEAIKG